MSLTRTWAITALNELEGLGLAARQRDTADRRRHIVTITPAGATALQAVDAVLNRTDDDLFAALSAEERDQLGRLLAKVVDASACGDS